MKVFYPHTSQCQGHKRMHDPSFSQKRLRPSCKNHVWAYDFVHDRTHDGRNFRTLTVIDEYTRECLAIVTKRKLKSGDVLEALENFFMARSMPDHILSDNGDNQSFNGKLRDEILDRERRSSITGALNHNQRLTLKLAPHQGAGRSLYAFNFIVQVDIVFHAPDLLEQIEKKAHREDPDRKAPFLCVRLCCDYFQGQLFLPQKWSNSFEFYQFF